MSQNEAALFPEAVYTIWKVGLAITLLVFVPVAVYSLNRTWRAARSIQRYAADALQAAAGIAGNTKNIVALDATISAATRVLTNAGAVEKKLGTIADVLAQRAK